MELQPLVDVLREYSDRCREVLESLLRCREMLGRAPLARVDGDFAQKTCLECISTEAAVWREEVDRRCAESIEQTLAHLRGLSQRVEQRLPRKQSSAKLLSNKNCIYVDSQDRHRLGIVCSLNAEKHSYVVADPEQKDKQVSLDFSKVFLIGTDAEAIGKNGVYRRGQKVCALYPRSTLFLPGTVTEGPEERRRHIKKLRDQRAYLVLFDSEEQARPRLVHARYVGIQETQNKL